MLPDNIDGKLLDRSYLYQKKKTTRPPIALSVEKPMHLY